MANHEPTTLAFPAREPRPLAILHALTPAEVDALIKVGENLADIQGRLAAMMGRPGGPIASELQDLALLTIDLLDVVEPDPEAEEGGDTEPSLGWSATGATGTLDASPFLSDLEEEHDGREPDADGEASRQPPRLDVILGGREAAHGSRTRTSRTRSRRRRLQPSPGSPPWLA